jgi:hypothetical protein
MARDMMQDEGKSGGNSEKKKEKLNIVEWIRSRFCWALPRNFIWLTFAHYF